MIYITIFFALIFLFRTHSHSREDLSIDIIVYASNCFLAYMNKTAYTPVYGCQLTMTGKYIGSFLLLSSTSSSRPCFVCAKESDVRGDSVIDRFVLDMPRELAENGDVIDQV